MSRYYDIDGNPMEMMAWALSLEGPGDARKIGADTIGDVTVSTVWLGLDHRFGEGPPLIFETMVFGGPDSDWQDRYTTKEQALAGHERVVAAVKAGERLA